MRREKKEAVSYPHVSSPLCIYGTYAHVLVLAVSVCRALGDFKWIFQIFLQSQWHVLEVLSLAYWP